MVVNGFRECLRLKEVREVCVQATSILHLLESDNYRDRTESVVFFHQLVMFTIYLILLSNTCYSLLQALQIRI